MQRRDTLFAFKLAAARDRTTTEKAPYANKEWRVRDGVAVAGCTDPKSNGVLREAFPWGDGRAYC
ncbi:MAG: hypothetical protein E6Q50_12720 [Lysobacter sp.]|nr:MAG: hypothetical protein E6Q50_12720 [Lysobacter sp.]